jgi:hypothetical protein
MLAIAIAIALGLDANAINHHETMYKVYLAHEWMLGYSFGYSEIRLGILILRCR